MARTLQCSLVFLVFLLSLGGVDSFLGRRLPSSVRVPLRGWGNSVITKTPSNNRARFDKDGVPINGVIDYIGNTTKTSNGVRFSTGMGPESMQFRPLTLRETLSNCFKFFFQPPWKKVKGRVVLRCSIGGDLPLEPASRGFSFGRGGGQSDQSDVASLEELNNLFITSAHDHRVVAIFIEIKPFTCGYAKLTELRRAMHFFRSSGKKIYSFMVGGSEKELFIASYTDRLAVPPEGGLDLRGFVGGAQFFRGAFDKIGVEPQVQRIGKYKSFGDSFNRTTIADAQREVVSSLLMETSDFWAENIAANMGGGGKENIINKNKSSAQVVRELWDSPGKMGPRTTLEYLEMGYIDSVHYLDVIESQVLKESEAFGDFATGIFGGLGLRRLSLGSRAKKNTRKKKQPTPMRSFIWDLLFNRFDFQSYLASTRGRSFMMTNYTSTLQQISSTTSSSRSSVSGSGGCSVDDSGDIEKTTAALPKQLEDWVQRLEAQSETGAEEAEAEEGSSPVNVISNGYNPKLSYLDYRRNFAASITKGDGKEKDMEMENRTLTQVWADVWNSSPDRSFNYAPFESRASSITHQRTRQQPREEPVKGRVRFFPASLYLRKTRTLTLSGSPFVKKRKGKRVAIINAVGGIGPGESNTRSGSLSIGSDTLIAQLRSARNDPKIIGVVLRIDSPGGSALASDLIWREILLVREKKPIIASQVDVAASGGYYLSMACDWIFAEETTVTGSIGVVTAKFNIAELAAKVGLSTEIVSRGRFAEVIASTKPFAPHEEAYFAAGARQAYESFVSKAAISRQFKSVENMHAVAQGRVWTGKQALDRNLVDFQGGLWDAVSWAKTLGEQEYVEIDKHGVGVEDDTRNGTKTDKDSHSDNAKRAKEPLAVEILRNRQRGFFPPGLRFGSALSLGFVAPTQVSGPSTSSAMLLLDDSIVDMGLASPEALGVPIPLLRLGVGPQQFSALTEFLGVLGGLPRLLDTIADAGLISSTQRHPLSPRGDTNFLHAIGMALEDAIDSVVAPDS